MIPIKNPNISTNRYKELLWFEKQYYKKNEEIDKLIDSNRVEFNKRIDVQDIIWRSIESLEKFKKENKAFLKENEQVLNFMNELLKLLKEGEK